MNRKFKLFFSLASLCLSVAMLCFGVYSAMSVSYTVNGSVSYEVKDVFVNVELSVYRALSEAPVDSSKNTTNLNTIQSAGDNIPAEDFGALSYTDGFSTYKGNTVTKPGEPYGKTLTNIDLVYGSPDNENQGYAFYIVIDIENLGSETINAVVQNDIIPENTLTEKTSDIEIEAKNTGRIVLGLSLEDVTKGITKSSFGYTIAITRGQLPAEITDLKFSFDEEKKEATVIGYTGTSGEMVIPETVGNHTNLTTKTLKFENVSEMMSAMGGKLSGSDAFSIADISYTVGGEKKTSNKDMVFAWLNQNLTATDITINFLPSYEINYEDCERLGITNSMDEAMLLLIGPATGVVTSSGSGSNLGALQLEKLFNTYYTVNIEGVGEYVIDKEAMQQYAESGGSLYNLYQKLTTLFYFNTDITAESFPKATFAIKSFGQKVTEGENYKVVDIADNACENTTLTSVEIPDSVQTIGEGAFDGCEELTTVTIGNGVKEIGSSAFSNTPWLTNLQTTDYGIATSKDESVAYAIDVVETIINEQLSPYMSKMQAIAGSAFSDCANLIEIQIPESTQIIGSFTFSGCIALTEIMIPNKVQTIGEHAFDGCEKLITVTIGNGVKEIRSSAFSNTPWLTNLQMTDYGIATSKDNSATYAIDVVETITDEQLSPYMSKLQAIADSAFSGCTALTEITIPDSVQTIGDSAFSGCTGLTVVNIAGVQTIENSCFYNCTNLTEITLSDNLCKIGERAFYGCEALSSITIPDSVQMIGESAFYGCKGLMTVNIGNGVKQIENDTFSNCTFLTEVILSDNLQAIGENAFDNCENLIEIAIPENVKVIEGYAFDGCTSLKTVTFKDKNASWTLIYTVTIFLQITPTSLSDSSIMAQYLTGKYCSYNWTKDV